jgi:hypothetical protein
MRNNRLPKIMLDYRQNGRRRLWIPLTRLLDETEAGLWRPNSWWMMTSVLKFFLIWHQERNATRIRTLWPTKRLLK